MRAEGPFPMINQPLVHGKSLAKKRGRPPTYYYRVHASWELCRHGRLSLRAAKSMGKEEKSGFGG